LTTASHQYHHQSRSVITSQIPVSQPVGAPRSFHTSVGNICGPCRRIVSEPGAATTNRSYAEFSRTSYPTESNATHFCWPFLSCILRSHDHLPSPNYPRSKKFKQYELRWCCCSCSHLLQLRRSLPRVPELSYEGRTEMLQLW